MLSIHYNLINSNNYENVTTLCVQCPHLIDRSPPQTLQSQQNNLLEHQHVTTTQQDITLISKAAI